MVIAKETVKTRKLVMISANDKLKKNGCILYDN